MAKGNVSEEEAKHFCKFDGDEAITRFIDSGPFIPWRRKIRRYFMISRSHPNTRLYVKSLREIRKQQMWHLAEHYFMIHPFSRFSLHWAYVMAVSMIAFFFVIPCLIGSPISQTMNIRWVFNVLQCIHCVHIIFMFVTGYHVESTNQIRLQPRNVAKHYLRTYFFIDFLSCLPTILGFRRGLLHKEIIALSYLRHLVYLKLLHIPLCLKYINIIQRFQGINDYVVNLFKFVLGFISCILWTYAIIWNTNKNEKWQDWRQYLQHLETATELLVLAGPKFSKDLQTELPQIVTIATMCLGSLFQLMLFIGITVVWKKYSSVSSRHDTFFREVDAFMRYNELPAPKRNRIKTYFHFKFQGNYYKEQAINGMLSDRLRHEVMHYVAEANMQNVGLLLHLPKDILLEFSKYLEVETYLAGDVIVRSGTMGESMYFIIVGTVGIAMPDGRLVAVLNDGMNFGEISLILEVARIANVIAMKPCEILRLNRNYFINAFARCTSKLEMLKELAKERLAQAQLFPGHTSVTAIASPSFNIETLHSDLSKDLKAPEMNRRITIKEEDSFNAPSAIYLKSVTDIPSSELATEKDKDEEQRLTLEKTQWSEHDFLKDI